MSYKQNVGFCRVLYYRPDLFIAFYKMDTFVKHNFGLMICNFFNKVRFLTNKLKLLIFDLLVKTGAETPQKQENATL